jgi:hypothetical protein
METYFADMRENEESSSHSYSLWIEIDEYFKTFNALWTHSNIEGCYERLDVEPSEQPRIQPMDTFSTVSTSPYDFGLILLPNGARVACCSSLFPEQYTDWFEFYFSIGTLPKAYGISTDALLKDTQWWREPLDTLLVDIARRVYVAHPFKSAHVGPDQKIDLIEARETIVGGIPKQRETGYLWPVENGLEWYPPTKYGRLKLTSW